MAGSSVRILVVDDDRDTQEALVEVLRDEGYETTSAGDPTEALAKLANERIGFVLTDAFGPPPDGLADAHRIAAAAQPVPVGFLSGWQIPPAEARQLGFAFVLSKPIEVGQLLTAVAQALGQALPDSAPQARVVRAWFDALTARDWDALTALCTPDVVYTLPGSGPLARVAVGRAELRQLSEETFAHFPESRFGDLYVFATPLGAAGRFTSSWREPGGTRASLSGAVVFELRAGAIARVGVRLDAAALAARLGAG